MAQKPITLAAGHFKEEYDENAVTFSTAFGIDPCYALYFIIVRTDGFGRPARSGRTDTGISAT